MLLLAAIGPSLLVAAIGAARSSLRARRLNRCFHELRRPLQSASLALDGARPNPDVARSCLDQAAMAAADAEAVVNGGRHAPVLARVAIAEVLDDARRRWSLAERVRVDSSVVEAALLADPRRLAAALDNLIANALEHGSGPVEVTAGLSGGGVARFAVSDRGGLVASGPRSRSPRHGHGLAVASEVAEAGGGRLVPPHARSDSPGTVAELALPTGSLEGSRG